MDKARSVHITGMPSGMVRHLNNAAKNAESDSCKVLTSFIDEVVEKVGLVTAGADGGKASGFKRIHNIGIKQKRKLLSIAATIGVPYGSLIKVLYHTERMLPEARRALANQVK